MDFGGLDFGATDEGTGVMEIGGNEMAGATGVSDGNGGSEAPTRGGLGERVGTEPGTDADRLAGGVVGCCERGTGTWLGVVRAANIAGCESGPARDGRRSAGKTRE